MSRPQGHSAAGRIIQLEKPMTLSGLEPATFRLVAQRYGVSLLVLACFLIIYTIT